ncbi:hypothetical protein [Nocardioides dongxiaopingii]|uniref:hypothetical protein n=1 Tax=Nocardioides dongxiaopingii TaxID=2576036 RepID=UPI0010C7661F|nr:hypothetical protein [Nocardioides dongxiaopingii]
MSDHLHDLLAREAGGLDVPRAPASGILADGRRRRGRRRATTGAAALAAVVALGGGYALLDPGSSDRDAVEPAGLPTADLGAAFAIGSTVHLRDGAVSVTLPAPRVGNLSYTSVGVVVQAYDADQEPLGTHLVAADGTVIDLDVPPSATSDPGSSLLAWTTEDDGVVTLVLQDVGTDERVAEVPLPDHPGGFAPARLDGDHVYVGGGDAGVLDVDLRTEEVTVAPDLEVVDEVAGGRSNLGYGGHIAVIDVATGEEIVARDVTQDSAGYFQLSPGGRFARYVDQVRSQRRFELYDLATGTSTTLPGSPGSWGWTADGRPFTVSDLGDLVVCGSGPCTTTRLDLEVLPNQYPDEVGEEVCHEFADGSSECTTERTENHDDDLALGGSTGWS